jgi:hypothetical protein
LSNVRTTLRTKHLSFHSIDMFYPLSTLQLQCFLFGWFFEIVNVCEGNWTPKIGFFNTSDLWTAKLKRLVLGVQFPHKCLDFIMKLYIHHHKLIELHRFKQILCEFQIS